jgi:hypothetical protein
MGAMTIELVPVNESDLPLFTDAVVNHLHDSVQGILSNFRGRRGQSR